MGVGVGVGGLQIGWHRAGWMAPQQTTLAKTALDQQQNNSQCSSAEQGRAGTRLTSLDLTLRCALLQSADRTVTVEAAGDASTERGKGKGGEDRA